MNDPDMSFSAIIAKAFCRERMNKAKIIELYGSNKFCEYTEPCKPLHAGIA